MGSRHPAWEAVRTRVIRAATENSAAGLLTEDAAREARELATLLDAEYNVKAAWALGMFHWLRYLSLPDGDDLADYTAAVRFLAAVYEEDPEVVPADLRQRYEQIRRHGGVPPPDPIELNSRACNLISSYRETGELPSLIEAVALFRAALAATDGDDASRAWRRSNLGAALRMLFGRIGERELLTEAINLQRHALAGAAEDERPACRSNLAAALLDEHELIGAARLVTEAVDLLQAAVDGLAEDDPERGAILANLAAAQTRLAQTAATTAALAGAVESHRRVLATCPEEDPERGRYLTNLGGALQALAERMGERALLAEAVAAHRAAVSRCPAGHPDRPGYLSNLAAALTRLSEATGDAAELREAVDLFRAVLAAASPGHLGRPGYLSNFAMAALQLGERTGNTRLMVEAVEASRIAVDLIPDGHPERGAHLSNLGLALQAMYQRTGNTDLLAEAVDTQRAAVAAARASPSGGADYLSNLGVTLRVMAETNGDTDQLAEAVQAGRAAVAAIPPGHPGLAGYLSNLGAALHLMFERSEQAELLAEAVQTLRAAAAVAPPGDPSRAGHLSNLGLSLVALFEQTGQTGPLREAAQIHRQAVAASPSGHPGRAGYLSNLGIALQALSECTAEEEPLAEAVTAFREAVAATGVDHSDRTTYLVNLANALQVRHDRAPGHAPPPEAGLLTEATSCYAEAAGNTGAPALRAAGHSAELYQAGAWQAAEGLAQTRQQAHQAWDELIDRIRASGFQRFLQAPGADELARQAGEGPVVFVFTSPVCCAAVALIAEPPWVRVVPLPGLTETEAYWQANQLRDARIRATADPGPSGPAGRPEAEQHISDVLAWLWDAITGPILAALGYTATPATGQDWPRLWWCPVGILGYLPLHAAGHHADTGASHPRTVLDRVVSSYTPTIRSLAYARAHRPPPRRGTTLIIAVPEAPGTPPLPGVIAEAEALGKMVPAAHRLPQPTRGRVLAALPEHAIAHFACHGYADLIDPGDSELVMPDRKLRPLTLTDISRLHMNARLAYLSACDTLFVRQNLADEAVHLTGAFHLAGYQHVIGTLWSINDAAATKLAVGVYARLTGNGTTEPDADLAARALHNATRDLRARFPDHPSLWVTHTHTGS